MTNQFSNSTCATGYIKPKTTCLYFDYIIRINVDGWLRDIDDMDYMPSSLPFIHKEEVYQDAHFEPNYFKRTENLVEDELRHYFINMALFKSSYIGSVVPIYDPKNHILVSRSSREAKLAPVELFVINQIPDIIEEKLSWEQVVDIRNDYHSFEKLKAFRNWTEQLNGQSESQIKEQLELSLADYKIVIQKHGIATTLGATTTVFSAASSFVGAMPVLSRALLSAGIAIAGGTIATAFNHRLQLNENKNHPMAFLYDTINSV